MDKKAEEVQRLASNYQMLWEKMRTDLLSRQGAIKTLSDKEKSIQTTGGTLLEAALILDETEKKLAQMSEASSEHFRKLREVIQDVPHGYERFFWELVSPAVLVHTK